MDIQTQELKKQLRSAWNSFKPLIGSGAENAHGEKLMISHFLTTGVYPSQNKDNICNGAKKQDCINALQKCMSDSGDASACRDFVQSSTFLKHLMTQTKKDVNGITGTGNQQLLKKILESIGFNSTYLNNINTAANGNLNDEVNAAFDAYKKGVPSTVYISSAMENVVKNVLRVYGFLLKGLDDNNKYKNNLGTVYDNRANKRQAMMVKLFGDRISNNDVVNYVQTVHNKVFSDIDTISLFLKSAYLLPMIGGGNMLSKNNIYSSINFVQSGGTSGTGNLSYHRRILTKYINDGLMSVKVEELVGVIEGLLGNKNLGFDKTDLQDIKLYLGKLKNYEMELLKVSVYINETLKQSDRLPQQGGSLILNTNKQISEALNNRGKEKATVTLKSLGELKTLLGSLSTTIESLDTTMKSSSGTTPSLTSPPTSSGTTSSGTTTTSSGTTSSVNFVDRNGRPITSEDTIGIKIRIGGAVPQLSDTEEYDIIDLVMNAGLVSSALGGEGYDGQMGKYIQLKNAVVFNGPDLIPKGELSLHDLLQADFDQYNTFENEYAEMAKIKTYWTLKNKNRVNRTLAYFLEVFSYSEYDEETNTVKLNSTFDEMKSFIDTFPNIVKLVLYNLSDPEQYVSYDS